MLRRKAKRQSLGAFVDTEGSRSKGKHPQRRGLSGGKREEDDEIEEKTGEPGFWATSFPATPCCPGS